MPLLWPIKSTDGVTEIDSIFLKKDTYLIISIWNANTNKAIWGEDGEEWKPERWLDRAPNTVANIPLSGIYSSMWVELFFECAPYPTPTHQTG